MNVHLLLFDGFGEMVSLAPFEVLKRANEVGADFDIKLISANGTLDVGTAYGVKIRADELLLEENRPDLLIVPGGGWNHRAIKGARKEAEKGDIPRYIGRVHLIGTIVAGVCTGGMLLAEAGILKGKKIAMHHLAADELKDYGAEMAGARIVDEGSIITARGVTAGVDLGLWIVERFYGPTVASAVEVRMEYERRGIVIRREGDQ
ncbi:DJ-1/PfpI family protein [Brevibacillus ginsengisoli]|uniref:DJ-1/PfpI family protein n=1 Tax=Brevibacillus ginsengisoli TaxID=363854 RepID=UPI003CE8F0AB